MSWYVYSELVPIDFNWDLLPTVESVAVTLAKIEAENLVRYGEDSSPGLSYSEFIDLWESAKIAAAEVGWEGDFRHPPCVLWQPVDDAFRPGFVIKQDNNGDTFVVSPVPLPHLED